ncbi:MAG: glycosyltransferase family 1 protein [SAR202 cluster bacterium]|nr:glycosyltransferase family 1 protein [SAR202 cluster bacterium]
MHGCPNARLGEKDTGGMNVYVLQVARELGKLGKHVDVFTRVHDVNEPRIVRLGENARVIHIDAGAVDETKEALHHFVGDFADGVEAFRRSEGLSYYLIHSHYWLSGVAAIDLSKRWAVPHVTTFHTLARTKMFARIGETEPQLRETAETEIIRNVDAVVVSTEQEKEDIVRLYQVSPKMVRIISAGVDLERFYPTDKAEARRRLGIADGEKIVLSVGRIEPLKGLDILIGALGYMESVKDMRLLIVGGKLQHDREVDRLRNMARVMGFDDVVTFTGTVPQQDLPTYYNAADVFVMPSYYESFGLVALEAMACGTPIVSTRVGGPRTFVKNGETGYIIPWHCPEPFAQRLDMVLSNGHLRASMGKSAAAKARTMGWDGSAARMLDLYSRLTAAKDKAAV